MCKIQPKTQPRWGAKIRAQPLAENRKFPLHSKALLLPEIYIGDNEIEARENILRGNLVWNGDSAQARTNSSNGPTGSPSKNMLRYRLPLLIDSIAEIHPKSKEGMAMRSPQPHLVPRHNNAFRGEHRRAFSKIYTRASGESIDPSVNPLALASHTFQIATIASKRRDMLNTIENRNLGVQAIFAVLRFVFFEFSIVFTF